MSGSKTLEYLKRKEWSMGNGQCPECEGVNGVWFGHPLHMDARTIGHKPDCTMAAMLRESGAEPLMVGRFAPTFEMAKRQAAGLPPLPIWKTYRPEGREINGDTSHWPQTEIFSGDYVPKWIKAEADRKGVSMSEILRAAIDAYMAKEGSK